MLESEVATYILLVLCGYSVVHTQPGAGEGDEIMKNPAYLTSASLIPSFSNSSYAEPNVTANTHVYEDVSAL